MGTFAGFGQGAACREVPQPMDFGEFQEHLFDNCHCKRLRKYA